MTKGIVMLCMSFWLAGEVSVFADALSSDPADDRVIVSTAEDSSKDERKVDPDAKAAYENAAKHEIKIDKMLQAIENIRYTAISVTSYASYATSSLKGAEQARDKRAKSLALLAKKGIVALELRNAALTAIDAYREAANETLKAITAYAGSDKDETEEKARLADAAMDKKAAMKGRAERAVAAVTAAGNDFHALLEEIQRYDIEVNQQLSTARDNGSYIMENCDSLSEMAKGQKPDLVAAVETSLPEVRPRVERFVKHATDAASLEGEAYRPLLDDLKKIGKADPAEVAAIEAYFEASVYAAVKNESYSFLVAMQELGESGKEVQAELDEGLISLRTALAEVDADKRRVLGGISAARNDQATLAARIEKLPSDAKRIAALIDESSTLVAGFEPVVKIIEQAFEEKVKEYAAARHAADKAYLVAFGRERREKLLAKAAAPAPSPLPLSSPIRVQEHVFTHFDALRGEPNNYGAYTYVLFRQNYATAQNHIKERYEALLNALYRSTSSADKFTAPVPKGKLNIFCIPFRKYVKDKKEYEEYDADLARSCLATAGSGAILRKDIVNQVRNSPGPFLLTTRTRLSEGSLKTQVLFVDLYKYPADTFDSILAAYKNTIVESPPVGQEVWTPPVTQRVVYAGVSVSGAIPGLLDKIKKVVDYFVPSAHVGEN